MAGTLRARGARGDHERHHDEHEQCREDSQQRRATPGGEDMSDMLIPFAQAAVSRAYVVGSV
jgi:hypothetical protein